MSTLTSTLNDLELNLDAIEDMMESMAVILGANHANGATAGTPPIEGNQSPVEGNTPPKEGNDYE